MSCLNRPQEYNIYKMCELWTKRQIVLIIPERLNIVILSVLTVLLSLAKLSILYKKCDNP